MKKAVCACLLILISVGVFGQRRSANHRLKDLNTQFMLRGYFYADSSKANNKAHADYGSSGNFPKRLVGMRANRGAILLIAEPNRTTTFDKTYKGMRVKLINATGFQISFDAEDNRISVIQEALDRDGNWKPIEYLPHSWCGNSYHKVILGAHEYWEFAAPVYTGNLKTKLRFSWAQRNALGMITTVYSNEFTGSVNPKQFSVHEGHQPHSIMDPYID